MITKNTTADELMAIRRTLGIVGLTLEQQPSGVYVARAKSVRAEQHVGPGDLLAVGAGVEPDQALDRAIAKFAKLRARAPRMGLAS